MIECKLVEISSSVLWCNTEIETNIYKELRNEDSMASECGSMIESYSAGPLRLWYVTAHAES